MTILAMPPGVTPDNGSNYGFFAALANLNEYSVAESFPAVTTAGTNSTLTAAQFLSGLLTFTAGASGGFTITLPSTASLFAAMPVTVPVDGSFSQIVYLKNLAVGQTGTLTAGDASTTLVGTMTIATNTTRVFLVRVVSGSTISITNLGSMAL